jgi:Rieske Fe-S protein
MADEKLHEPPEGGIDRRRFILLAAAAASAVAASPRSVYTKSTGEQLVDAGPLGEYAADGVYQGFRDVGFFLIRKGDKLVALSSNCTHRKCRLNAEKDHSFYCKCHGSTFDPNGKVTEGPATRNLPQFSTLVEKGHLFVKIAGT